MPFYSVTLPESAIGPRLGGYNTQVVFGYDATDALAAAKSLYTSDNDACWAAATVTELTAPNTLEGVELRVTSGSAADAYNRVYSFVGLANAKLTDLLEGMKVLLVADATNFPSAPTRSGLVLTIGSGNNVGDKTITCAAYLNGVLLPNLVFTVSATGSAASARTITATAGTMQGSRLRVTIADPTNPMDLSVYLHDAETIDLAGARLVVLMDAHALIGGGGKVTYSANVITVAGATAAQGAKAITATWTRNGVALPELALTVNAAGISSIDRTITFAADGTLPIPVYAKPQFACKV